VQRKFSFYEGNKLMTILEYIDDHREV